MAEIDGMLANMARRGVNCVVIVGGEPMRIQTEEGEAQGSTISSEKLQALVREVLPVALRPRLLQEGRYQFPYRAPSGSFWLSVERRDSRLQVEVTLTQGGVEEAGDQDQAPSTPAPAQAPPPRDWKPRALAPVGSHSHPVTALATAPHKGAVASVGTDGTVLTWGTSPAQSLLTLRQPVVHAQRATLLAPQQPPAEAPAPSVAFSREGSSVAASGLGAVQVWDSARGAGQFKENVAGPSYVAFGASGTLVFTRGVRVEAWDLAKRKIMRGYIAPSEALAVATSHDGLTVAVGTASGVGIGDIGPKPRTLSSLENPLGRSDRAVPITHFVEMGAPVSSASFSPRGSGLAVIAGGRCALLDSATQRVLWKQGRQGVRAVAFAPSGSAIAAANEDGHVYFLDWASGAPCHEPLSASPSPLNAVAFSSDGRLLLCAGQDGQIRAWALF